MALIPSSEKLRNKPIFGFDIETKGEDNIFLMGSIVGKNNFKKVFWDKKQMQDYFLNSHELRNSYIFATNLGFDFTSLFDLIDVFYLFEFNIRNTNFISIKYKKNNFSWTMLDTLNFLKTSVENLGKIINIPKLKKPYFLGEDIKLNKNQKEELLKYNINDSLITYSFAEFMQEVFNSLGANMKYTIASTSLNLFRRKYLKYRLKQPSKKIIMDMYKAYYGGRTEVFYRGIIKNCFYYDINSLYPYVMKKYKYPNPNTLEYSEEGTIEKIKLYDGITFCEIDTLYCDDIVREYPLLPYRNKEGKLIFPLGKFKGWYSNVELRKALELNYMIKPYKMYYYTENINLYDDFVYDLYKKRLEYKNTKFEIVIKILLNSLYGKAAQKLEQQEILFNKNVDIDKYHYENIKRLMENKPIRYKIDIPNPKEFFDKKGNCVIKKPDIYYIIDLDKKRYPKFINPILSLYTTSYARLELYKYIEENFYNGYKTFYCDTDSIITDNPNVKTSKILGDMKKELNISEGLLIKPKFYYLEGYDEKDNKKEFIKSKGLMNLNKENFFKSLEDKKYQYMKFSKFKESIRQKTAFNKKMIVTKDINLEDNKRNWENKELYKDRLINSKPLEIEI